MENLPFDNCALLASESFGCWVGDDIPFPEDGGDDVILARGVL